MIRKIDSNKFSLTILKVTTFSRIRHATGNENWIELLHSKDWGLIDIMKPKMTELLRQYYFVGGMPGVVSKFIENTDLQQVRTLQRDILEAYRRDISKHTSAAESTRIREVLDSLPSQLARENKKFIYGAVRKGSRAKDFEQAIQWLVDAGIVYRNLKCRLNFMKIGMPLNCSY